MAIRIRRGTDLQRQSILFELAEIVFVTDTEKIWIGDGVTTGGLPVDDQSLTYDSSTNTITTSDGHTVVITNIPTLTQIAHWDDAYNNTIISASISGNVTKTLNLNQRDGGLVSVSYTDTYVYTQAAPSASWAIVHNMNKYPSVTIIDSGSNIVEGEVIYNSLNSLTVNFSGGFSGKAYIN